MQKKIFLQEDFLRPILTLANTPNRFFFVEIFVFNICIYLGKWGVEGAMCKILELLDQHPQRNYLSKLATFGHIFQLPHSALITNFICMNNSFPNFWQVLNFQDVKNISTLRPGGLLQLKVRKALRTNYHSTTATNCSITWHLIADPE